MTSNITIQKIINVLLQRVKFIILVSLAAAMIFFLYSKFFISPMYSTSAMIYVQNYSSNNDDPESINQKNKKIYGSDISGSSNLAKLCITLFKNSDEVTAQYSGCSVNYKLEEDSFYVTVTVDGTNPEKCTQVANNVCEVAKKVFREKFSFGEVGVIRTAKIPSSPYSPNNIKDGLIGFVVGLVGSCLIAILLELIDMTIKVDDDITKAYGIPVFAEIPDFDSQG